MSKALDGFPRRHDSIMRPPLGKKHIPWRVADTETAYDRLLAKWGQGPGYLFLEADPSWLMVEAGVGRWQVMRGGRVLADHLTRHAAAQYPFKKETRA